jgi:hypothetical protein
MICSIPTRATISKLIFKRAYARINNKRTALNSNNVVEEHLGDCGVICLDDIVHEFVTGGSNFARIAKFLR